tara:strand:- start:398 stop:505 length:108 start_codon:yes stop_codon:yes gene_type:complete
VVVVAVDHWVVVAVLEVIEPLELLHQVQLEEVQFQ